ANAGHRDAGFGDIGAEDDATTSAAASPRCAEDSILLVYGEPAVQGQQAIARPASLGEGFGLLADFALAGEEDEGVAGGFVLGLAQGEVEGFVEGEIVLGEVGLGRAVADVDGVAAAGDFDD